MDGKAAFTLHPSTGTISGTPELDLSSDTLGRGSLDVTCKVALGGAGSAAVAAVWTVDIYIYIYIYTLVTLPCIDDMGWGVSQLI